MLKQNNFPPFKLDFFIILKHKHQALQQQSLESPEKSQ